MSASKKTTVMQLQVSLPKRILLTSVIMFALILLVYHFNIPNPNMILIAGLVLCSALFGFGGGIVAAVIMLGYSLFFFSTDHSFVHFTPQNMQKVIVSLVGITADMLFVCLLKQAELQAFAEVEQLTQDLHEENEKLQRASLTDALTGIRNRLALRQDYEIYQGKEITVMMLDLNDFKLINDTRGHEEGDRILKETGKLLADTFGVEHCYRYGGDEFLVIVPDLTEEKFKKKLDAMLEKRPAISETRTADFSTGCVHAVLSDRDKLRALIRNADEKMYEAKRDKSSRVLPAHMDMQTESSASEYTVRGLRTFLKEMSGKYDLARVVDPIECRILELGEDGAVSMNESCYSIWNAEQRCINCSSARACRTGCHQEKTEHFRDNLYKIQSNPIVLRLDDGSTVDAVVELVNVQADTTDTANDREAENLGARASHYFARHDRLTNVLNADAFYELSRELIKKNPAESWVMITANIMNFRLINTLFGVLKGNEVLVRTAALLREVSEATEGLCGRLGGDQFALLIPRKGYKKEALLRISDTLSKNYNSGIYTFCIHFGVYEIDDASVPVSVMCGRANSALRTIRDDMSAIVAHFDDGIRNKLRLEQMVIGSFEDALRDRQFKMYLQPFASEDGGVFAAEALVRWHRPDGTVLMPGNFIETLEHTGLIQKLDLYMWELAVKQLSKWKGTEKGNIAISVNMSAKDFYSMDILGVLTGLVEKYGVDSRLLRLEITETALLGEPERINRIVSSLREKGFLVAIDDFGTGFSSLSMIKTIQADIVKIDMEFLREIENNERNSIILRSVIKLADALGMDVITEGVETEQQLRTLAAMGCRHFQGYYFSRPVSVAEFEAKLSGTGGAAVS